MTNIIDLSDERRAAKTWLPADDRDVTNGLVVADSWGKPACVAHGAMNRISPPNDTGSRLYRCSECGVGAALVDAGDREGERGMRRHDAPIVIPATGNSGRSDVFLEVSWGVGNLDEDEPEVHLMMRTDYGDFAQGWFRLADLTSLTPLEESA